MSNKTSNTNSPSLGHYFTNNAEREALIRLCERRHEAAAALWPEASDCRERSRLEDALEQLLELIKFP